MPILPVVDTVSDPEFGLDFCELHFHVQLERKGDKEIVVSAVDEPLDRSEGRQRRLGRNAP